MEIQDSTLKKKTIDDFLNHQENYFHVNDTMKIYNIINQKRIFLRFLNKLIENYDLYYISRVINKYSELYIQIDIKKLAKVVLKHFDKSAYFFCLFNYHFKYDRKWTYLIGIKNFHAYYNCCNVDKENDQIGFIAKENKYKYKTF